MGKCVLLSFYSSAASQDQVAIEELPISENPAPMASAHDERRERKPFSDEEVNSVLVNPFLGKDHTTMDHLVQEFMAETEIDPVYREDIRKGAFLAQNSRAFAQLREDKLELKPEEKEALNQETYHKWRQPWILYALVGCCSLGAAVQGWDEVSCSS